ncbi:MAG: hypothetical protein ACJAWI_002468 [Marinomonas primoryensis]|jgi:hypothetical protein
MDASKITRIKGLTKEVDELHPLLRVLIPRLPNISNCEYRQGPSEMGADFVLTKIDETLDHQEYIGCIVKIGQIKQDHQEINRQIEECEIERTLEGGKKKIYLSEIWIISNDSITQGAQDKIHHKYKNKNIKFISGEKLSALIDKHYPEFWKDTNIETGKYLREITEIAENICKNTNLIDLPSSDIYIQQELIKIEKSKRLSDHPPKRQVLTLEKALLLHDLIIIEAMMGTGKSTLIAQTVKRLSSQENYNATKKLPVLFTAQELSKKYNGDLEAAVSDLTKDHKNISPNQHIIFIDGLDELKTSNKERADFLNIILSTSKTIPNCKIIISTRTIDDPELETELDKNFCRLKLSPLSMSQIISLVDRICQNTTVKFRLQKDLNKSHLLKVLPRTPISAILLAKVLNESTQEIPSTMTELYDKYIELSLGRWDMKKGLQSQQEYDVIHNTSMNLAEFMLTNSLQEISIGDLENLISNYTDSRNLKTDKTEILNKIAKKEEIFRFNNVRGTISFRHRTFAEYFYAAKLCRDNSALINEEIYDLYWANAYFFYIGLKRDCPEILDAIDKIEFSEERYRVLKVLNNGNFLLAAYLTPYVQIGKSMQLSFTNAAEIFDDITKDNCDSPLAQLPQAQLLCVLTKLLCDTFSYDFFEDALIDRCYSILTKRNIEDIEYIELFFLNSVRASLNKDNAFDTLIKDYGKKIPLSLQIGIIEHSSDMGLNSSIVKRYTKKFHKGVKTNPSLRKSVIDLYEKPMQEKEINSNKS